MSGPFSFVCPGGVTAVIVECWAGGGGGGVGQGPNNERGGGGGGAYSRGRLIMTPGNSYSGNLGAGGPQNNNGTYSILSGDLGLDVRAEEGKGGLFNAGGLGGLAVNGDGDVKYNGGKGGDPFNSLTPGAGFSGGGGGSGGDQGNGAAGATPGAAAAVHRGGAGGTGRVNNSGSPGDPGGAPGGGGGGGGFFTNGGVGADGCVIVWDDTANRGFPACAEGFSPIATYGTTPPAPTNPKARTGAQIL